MSIEGNAVAKNVLKGKIVRIPQIDSTLTKEGYGADAKIVGDKLKEMNNNVSNNSKASAISFLNEGSGLEAKNVQQAIIEIVNKAKTDLENLAKVYLAVSGGTLTGLLKMQSCENGHGAINKNHSETADYGTYMQDTSKSGASAKVTVCAEYGTFTYTDAEQNVRDVLHEGNKAFSNYTGNGGTASRTIDTKGIGRLCLVYSSGYILFVTPKGALKVTLADSSISWISSTNIHYLDGKIVIASDNEAFNKSNETYYYQVI